MDVGGLLERFAPPPGDAAQVRETAEQWRRAADALQRVADEATSRSAGLTHAWHGPASTAFGAAWTHLASSLSEGSGQLRAAAAALERVAAAVEQARARYWQVLTGAGVAVAVGLLLTPLTFGTSDVVADSAAAGEIGVLLAALSEALGVEASVLAGIAASGARLVGAFAVQAGAVVATDAVTGAVLFPDHDPRPHVDVEGDLEVALAAAVAAPLRGVLAGGAGRLLPSLVDAGPKTRAATGVVLDGASLGIGNAAVQPSLGRNVDPGSVAFAALGGSAGSLVGRALLAGRAAAAPALPAQASPPLAPQLARIFDESAAVPAGRSFFSAQRDPWFARTAPLVRPEPGTGVVFVHGTKTSVVAGGTHLRPHELAALIRADPRLAGRPVRLFACETGQLDEGFAHRLAQELAVAVHAPTQLAWLGPDGRMYTTSGRIVDDHWVLTVPHDGHWRTFPPGPR